MRKRLLGFILIMLISMPFVSAGWLGDWWNTITGRAVSDAGLVAYLNLDGTANDASGNGNNGGVVGAVDCFAAGKIGNSCNFDSASEYIKIDTQNVRNVFAPGSQFSISLWFNPSNAPASGDWVWLFSKDYATHTPPYYQFSIWYNGDKTVSATVWRNDTGAYLTTKSTDIMQFGTWHHVVVTADLSANILNLYTNGVLKEQDTSSEGNYSNYFTPITLGKNKNVLTSRYTYYGKIDEVRIYNRVLSSSEVQELASQTGVTTTTIASTTTTVPITSTTLLPTTTTTIPTTTTTIQHTTTIIPTTTTVLAMEVECLPGSIIGDINQDGKITEEDSRLVLSITTGLIARPQNICCADVSRNGQISSYDASLILQIVAGTGTSPGTCPGAATTTTTTTTIPVTTTTTIPAVINAEINIITSKDEYSAGEQVTLTREQVAPITGMVAMEMRRDTKNKLVNPEGEYKGYIIQLKSKTPLEVNQEIEQLINNLEAKLETSNVVYSYTLGFVDRANIAYNRATRQARVNRQLDVIREEHELVKGKVARALGKNIITNKITGNVVRNVNSDAVNLMGEFNLVFNGIALDITDVDAHRLTSIDEIEKIYPNYIANITLMNSVPFINADDVWQLDEDGNNCAISGKDCLTGKDITIAIIDTGVDYTHPDLGRCTKEQFLSGTCWKVIDGFDFPANKKDQMDDHGHGTHVAGIAAGNGALKGVAPDAKIIAYDVFEDIGGGRVGAYSNNIIAAIERAIDPNQDGLTDDHADIISMSLGGYGNPDDPQSQAVDLAVENGVVVVISAGNSGPARGTIGSPGTARKSITVGATYNSNQVVNFSSRGPVEWEGGAIIKPDIVSPGYRICSAQWNSAWNDRKCFDNDHVAISGTSMAAPHVSGAAALLLQKNPSWSPLEIKLALRNTAIDGGYGPNIQGYGRIDILMAIMLSFAPPLAMLDNIGQRTVSGVIQIKGTAISDNFQKYTLFYGSGESPSSWIEIHTSTNPVNDGVLYGWNTLHIPDGTYTIKLVVTDNLGQSSIDKILTTIDHIKLDYPAKIDFLDKGIITLLGYTTDPNFNYYKIEYGLGKEPVSWNEIIYSTSPANGILGRWDTSALEGTYTLRLTVWANSQIKEQITSSILIYDYLEGWPQREGVRDVVAVLDLDNDGDNELISNSASTIFVWNNDGTIADGWPQYSKDAFPVFQNLAVGDIDGDGDMEIIAVNSGDDQRVWAYHHDGTVVDGWPVHIGSYFMSVDPVIGDLDGDGDLEIIIVQLGKIHVFNHDGTYANGWPKGDRRINFGKVAIADLDDDGDLEIVQANRYEINIWHHDGTDFLKIQNIQTDVNHPPVIGDLDNDGNYEIIVVGIYGIFAYRSNGTLVRGFPVKSKIAWSKLSLGDIDNNGYLEIVYIDFDGNISIIDHNGQHYTWNGFDGPGEELIGYGYSASKDVSLADIDGDQDLEILFTDWDEGILAWNPDGSLVEGWPKKLVSELIPPADSSSTALGVSFPTMADVDNDGDNELVVSTSAYKTFDVINGWQTLLSGVTFVLNLEGNPSKIEWGMPHYDRYNSGAYKKISQARCGNNIKEGAEECDGIDDTACPDLCQNDCTCGNVASPGLPSSYIYNKDSISLTGYLTVKVQKYINNNWNDVKTVVNDISPRTIAPDGYINLNNMWIQAGGYTTDLVGTFRVYAEFKDSKGDIINAINGPLSDSYQFTVITTTIPTTTIRISVA